MRVPLSWLADYVDVELAPEALAETLTMLGLEVTTIERRGEEWQGVVVGELLDVRPHPGAERLLLATASTGQETPSGATTFQIVCGACLKPSASRRVIEFTRAAARRLARNRHRGYVASQSAEGCEKAFGILRFQHAADKIERLLRLLLEIGERLRDGVRGVWIVSPVQPYFGAGAHLVRITL